jgi:putative ABC transport system permease protein
MGNGFRRTIEGSGADDIAIVMRGGSQSEINSLLTPEQVKLIEEGAGIAKDAQGRPLVSPELYLVVDGIKRTTGTKANLPLRGIGTQGAALRHGIVITAGRMFTPGGDEMKHVAATDFFLKRAFHGLHLTANAADTL